MNCTALVISTLFSVTIQLNGGTKLIDDRGKILDDTNILGPREGVVR